MMNAQLEKVGDRDNCATTLAISKASIAELRRATR